MKNISSLFATYLENGSSRFHLPEVRKLDLSPNLKSGVQVLPLIADKPFIEPFKGFWDPWRSFLLLDCFFDSLYPQIIGKSSREKYLFLPKSNRTERIVAEIYRILRVYNMACVDKVGKISYEQNRICINLIINCKVYSYRIFKPGLDLLTSAVIYYLSSFEKLDPLAYIEAVLSSYYIDINDQIRDFHDEDDDVLVFRPKFAINRHFRYASGNATLLYNEGFLEFKIDDFHKNSTVFPIDFYFTFDQKLYIIPVEALCDGKIHVSELPDWKANDGVSHE
jgi:hypothetical protein